MPTFTTASRGEEKSNFAGQPNEEEPSHAESQAKSPPNFENNNYNRNDSTDKLTFSL